MKMVFTAQTQFQARDLMDAFRRLRDHFDALSRDEESRLEFTGHMTIRRKPDDEED